ncbi:MAG: sulfatase [Gemmatimonadetes bacterium]|nr:sulfatase [Gemmatimonadota bacterium]
MPHLSRRKFIGGLAVGGVGLAAGSWYLLRDETIPFPASRAIDEIVGLDQAFTGRPPNIILVNCDDLGYGDLGCYGSTAVKTPRIDALAQQGVRFTDFHACDSVCTPSRAGLLTGRYPKRMRLDFPLMPSTASLKVKLLNRAGFVAGAAGVMDMDSEVGAEGLDAFEVTIGEALQRRGYRTAIIGKWHLGDFKNAPRFHPLEHGFQSFFGVPHSNDMSPFPLYRNREVIEAEIVDRTKLTGLYTDEAIRVIEANKGTPFFLYLAHTYPHRPLAASAQFKNESDGGAYGDTIEEIDWNMGRLMEALTRNGLDKNTLVLFTSDNGPWYDGSPAGFRGRKGQSFEGGHRVPMIARWEGTIPRGTVCDAPTMNIDTFPTFLSLAGIRIPSDRLIDGVSMVDLFTHPASSPSTNPRELYFYHQGTLEGIRSGDWKLIRSANHYVWPMPVNGTLGRLSRQTTGPLPLLFNLRTDPGEAYNVAGRYAERVRELTAVMQRWEADLVRNPFGLSPAI